jgi:hypothetical protein
MFSDCSCHSLLEPFSQDTRLPAHVPHEAAIPVIHRNALQTVGKLQRLLVVRGHPMEGPRWKYHTQ